MWSLGAYAWLFAGTLLLEALVIPLGGAAIHHGHLSVGGVVVVALLGSISRSVMRHRYHRRKAARKLTWFQRVVAPRPSSLFRSLVWVGALLSFGYVAGHVIHGFPPAGRLAFGIVGLLLLLLLIARAFEWLPDTIAQKTPRIPPGALLHSAAVGAIASVLFLIPWWPPTVTSVEKLVVAAFEARHLTPEMASLKLIDEPRRGLRNAIVQERALLLAHAKDAPPDVYLVHLSYSHDGRPARVTDVYNLSDTASVAEGDLQVWRKWAAWTIRLEKRPLSVEVADFRGEAPGRGEGWGKTERVQRALTNLQETGQMRGIGRTTVRLVKPAKALSARLDGEQGVLHVELDHRTIELPLGRDAQDENERGFVEVSAAETPIPGDLVTWSVDRLRTSPWIGSDRMQWVKGLVFKAADKIETIENDLVGIDVDEAISEELGDVLESLPLAKAGDIPDWPPAPIEPLLKPPLAAEGRWVDMARDVLVGTEGDRGGSPFVFSFIRTDPARTYNQVSVTLWDPRRIELHITAGTDEPTSMTGQIGSGSISREPEVLERLVGAFNGAFQAVHGEFGMMEDRRVILPPKPYAATVVTLDDGSAGFGTWPLDHTVPKNIVGYRQNMSPLVVGDQVNPYKRHWWGGVPEGWTEETRTVRSGLCYTKEGFMAYFYSPSIDPDRLGAAMLRVRCTYGIHLDMNAGHTGFEFYRVAKKGSLPGLGRPLDAMWEASGTVTGIEDYEFLSRLMVRKMPLMNFPRYIRRSPRDFFYLTRRILLPGPPLPGPPEAPLATVNWGILATDTNHWPHAVAVAEVPFDTQGETPAVFRLTRIDGKQVQTRPATDEGAVVLSLSLPGGEVETDAPSIAANDEGQAAAVQLALFATKKGFRIGPSSNAQWGAPLALGFERASEETTSGLCLTYGDLLTLFEVSGRVMPEAWPAIMDRAGCQQRLYFSEASHLIVSGVNQEARNPATTLKLQRMPFVGARRVFEDTPILHPTEWAIPQARRVPYVPNSPETE